MKERQPFVKKHTIGYGITNGTKWFFYAYPSLEKAEQVLANSDYSNEVTVRVNLSYPEPMQLVP